MIFTKLIKWNSGTEWFEMLSKTAANENIEFMLFYR